MAGLQVAEAAVGTLDVWQSRWFDRHFPRPNGRQAVADEGTGMARHLDVIRSCHMTRDLALVERGLNTRPRRILDDRIPAELFEELLASNHPRLR